MSELHELRELKIGMEHSEGFFVELEELLAKYLEIGAPLECVAFYLNLAHSALLDEAKAAIYEDEE